MNLFDKHIFSNPPKNELEICVFGPGYGESILLYIPCVGWGVIDSCQVTINRENFSLPLQYLLEYFSGSDFPELEFVILTHPHEDHYRGLDRLLLDYPGKIKRVCWYGGVGIKELKYYLIRHDRARSQELPGLIDIFKAFDTAQSNGAQKRLLSEFTNILDFKNVDVEGYGKTDIIFKSLSPSAGSATKYTKELFDSIPVSGQPLSFVNERAHNLISVSLLLSIGDIQILLGGDLENHTTSDIGWKCLIENVDCPPLWANLIKVAHHGSSSGFNKSAWEAHKSKGRPISMVTPFVRGRTTLPMSDDLIKIEAVSSKVGVSSTVEYSELTNFYSRKEALAIKAKAKSVKLLKPIEKIGFLRVRLKLDATITETYAEAPAFWK